MSQLKYLVREEDMGITAEIYGVIMYHAASIMFTYIIAMCNICLHIL